MTPRARILAAADRRTTDVLPVGFKATAEVLARFGEHLAVADLFQIVQRLPVDTWGVLNNYDLGVFPEYGGGPPLVLYPDTRPDGTWDAFYGYQRKWVAGAGGRNGEVITNPLATATTAAEVERHAWPSADWFDYGSIDRQCREAGDHAIVFLGGSLGQTAHLIGLTRFWMDMIERPELIDACFAHLAEFFVGLIDRTLAAAGGRIDIVCVQDDVGMQTGPMISPDTYRRFFLPHHRRIFEVVHRHGARAMMHSCGAVVEFIPDFIEIGADILDPVQTTAAGMDPATLKRRFGRDICFHGGIDTQDLLSRGTPDDVRRHVDHLVRTLGEGGGFILAPAHYLQPDAPWPNITAVFDAIGRWR